MTTQKLSDEELAKLTGLGAGSISSWYCSDFIRHTAASMLIEIIESRAKLARVEDLVSALEEIKVKCAESAVDTKSLDCQSLGFMASRRARLALENWRKE